MSYNIEQVNSVKLKLTVKNATQKFCWISPGSFIMGSPENEKGRRDNEIQHQVTLTKGFWLSDTTCSQEFWQSVMENNLSTFKGKDLPVDSVSWHDCQLMLDRLNKIIPAKARLPTEAEWEYACRADSTTPYSFGETISTEQANLCNYADQTVPVKYFKPNNWGLFQMHGNVWEWCNDWYDEYTPVEVSDPLGSEIGELKVLRGGSWYVKSQWLRSAFRDWSYPDVRSGYLGFRIALDQF